MSDGIDITFTEAYEQLKAITDRLNAEQVEADALVPLLRDGKGLEAALRTHLTQVEQEVKAIEAGQGITAYRIVDGTSAGARNGDGTAVPRGPTPPLTGAMDDDIPF